MRSRASPTQNAGEPMRITGIFVSSRHGSGKTELGPMGMPIRDLSIE
jgi:hypothetical protein